MAVPLIPAAVAYTAEGLALGALADRTYTEGRRGYNNYQRKKGFDRTPKDEQKAYSPKEAGAPGILKIDESNPDEIARKFGKELFSSMWTGDNLAIVPSDSPMNSTAGWFSGKGNHGRQGSTDKGFKGLRSKHDTYAPFQHMKGSDGSLEKEIGSWKSAGATVSGLKHHRYKKPVKEHQLFGGAEQMVETKSGADMIFARSPLYAKGAKQADDRRQIAWGKAKDKPKADLFHAKRTDFDEADYETRYDSFHDYEQPAPKTPAPWSSTHRVDELLGGKKKGLGKRLQEWVLPNSPGPRKRGAAASFVDFYTGAFSIADMMKDGKSWKPAEKQKPTGLRRNFDPGGA